MEKDTSRYQMSAERLDELKKELEYMQTVREREVAEQIKEARSFGDLSENSEYDEAKAEQGKLYSKIAEYQDLIENAVIIETVIVEGVVSHGSIVTILDVEEDEEYHYTLVGSQEANPMENRLSSDSPLGRSIIGHMIGETVMVPTPDGEELPFKILAVEH